MARSSVIVPQTVHDAARDSIGEFFAGLSGYDPETTAKDQLDVDKALTRVEALRKLAPIEGKKLLEIGSGYGTNLAVFVKDFGIDGYGVEPDGEGFGRSYASSRELFTANGLDANRIVAAVGEALPFPDQSFDLIYSSYVLEHVQNPEKVLAEAVRVLKAGGTAVFELPNHLSYFEGHYFVPMPPLVFNFLPFWVKLLGRDPAFAKTLRTEINPIWCRRTVKKINQKYPVRLLTLGEKDFLDRLEKPFQFEMQRVAGRIGFAVRAVQMLNAGNWIGRTIVGLQGFYPISMVLQREPAK